MVNYKRGSGNYKSSYLQLVIKDITTSEISETTVQNDSELHLSLKANKRYAGYAQIYLSSTTTADFKYTFAAIVGSSVALFGKGLQKVPAATIAFGTTANNSTDASVQCMFMPFTIRTTQSGTLQFMWAQNTTDAFATDVKRGSMLVCYEA